MRRALLACLAAALALPASAGAATVRLEDEFDQRSNTTSQEVVYDALSGEANDLRATYDVSRFYSLTDPAGITPGRGCTRPNPLDATRARCEVTAGGGTSGITVNGGDGNDIVRIDGGGGDDELAAQLDTFEPGRQRSRDRIRGGSGRDTIGGSAGSNRLSGGPSPDLLHAGRGNDRISARDGRPDRIACGRGRDRARLDGFDYFADRCERVRRSFLPAAVP